MLNKLENDQLRKWTTSAAVGYFFS